MNLYVIYDNLYEEYQMPFTMKNDNIAKIEFQMFIDNAIDKAPEKEKAKTRNRFVLCKYIDIQYHQASGTLIISARTTDSIQLSPEPMTLGEEDNE